MANYSNVVMGDFAIAQVSPGTGFTFQRGFSGFVKNGAGDTTLTLTNPLASTASLVSTGLLGNAVGQISVELVDSTHVRVRTSIADGTATDRDYCIRIDEVAP